MSTTNTTTKPKSLHLTGAFVNESFGKGALVTARIDSKFIKVINTIRPGEHRKIVIAPRYNDRNELKYYSVDLLPPWDGAGRNATNTPTNNNQQTNEDSYNVDDV